MRSTFEQYHPVINFVWFCAVILSGMLLLHPMLLSISVIGSAVYAVSLGGKKTLKFILCGIIPMILIVTAVNPLVNHKGVTILTYWGDNPVTMEAIVYGMVSAFMFAAMFLWFSCYNRIMTSDKFVYLFGRIIPTISLIFSMMMRFIPGFKVQIHIISQAQKCAGRDASNGKLLYKIKHALKILSIMITWALENAIDTADSMKSRGYGLRGRTAFSLYRFDARDRIVMIGMLLLLGIVLAGGIMGICRVQYYPYIELAPFHPASAAVYAAYLLLCFLPVILDVKEAIQWKRLQLKI